MMDIASNAEDTTTTDYDSGDSEGVSYAYEGGKGLVCSKQPLVGSPGLRGKPKSRSPKGKPRSPMRCACEAPRKPTKTLSLSRSRSPSELDDADSTSHEGSDTDMEGGEDRLPPARQRLPGPANSERGRRKSQKSESSKSSTKSTRKRSPYIEEYPHEEKQRPVILLKEHKLPRNFSGSDTKQYAQAPEDRQGVTSAPRGRSPPRKWLSASTAHPEAQVPRRVRPGASPKKRHSEIPCAPGGKFSDLDQGSPEPESPQKKSIKGLEKSPPRRRRSHGTGGSCEMTSPPQQRPAWPRQLQYSSSWPLQTGPGHASRPGREPVYDSDEEDDHTPYTQPQHGHLDREAGHGERRHGSQSGGHIVNRVDFPSRDQEDLRAMSRRPSHGHSSRHPQASNLQTRHREPASLDQPSQDRDFSRHPQSRPPQPPRPIVARTIISQRSMANMDQGYPRASTATSMCEIWRGHPEDWESPYSSSEDEDGFIPDIDGEPVPFLKHLALEESPYHDSNASYFSGRSRSRSRHSHQRHSEFLHQGSAGTVGFLRRSDNPAGLGEFDGLIRCESPERMDDGGRGGTIFLDVAIARGGRAVSRARSRWSVMAPRERDLEDPPVRRWVVDVATSGGRQAAAERRTRSPSPVFSSARKTREFLSPTPRRPAMFDFDAWDRERASRSTLALGPSPGFGW